MNDEKTLSDRIDALETRLTFQDETIETLNKTITAQWQQIDALTRQLAALSERLQEAENKLAGAEHLHFERAVRLRLYIRRKPLQHLQQRMIACVRESELEDLRLREALARDEWRGERGRARDLDETAPIETQDILPLF